MSYISRHRIGLSGILDAATDVVSDPCLDQVATLATTMNSLQQTAPTPGQPTPPPVPGIGLCSLVQPLQLVVWVEQNPMLAMAAGLGAVGLLIAIGYSIAKKE